MTLAELLLLPIYILLFYLYFRRKRKRLENDVLKKYHLQAFWLKILATILFVIYYTYLTSGDTRSLYFPEGKNFFNLLLQDGGNWKYVFDSGKNFPESLATNSFMYGYYRQEGNFMVIRLTAMLSFLTFGQYLLINLFFGMFAFSGLWKLFFFFYNKNPEMHKAFAISILFFPSVLFWSSGLLKDSIVMGAMGWFTYSIDRVFQGKSFIRYGLISAVSAYLIIIIKVYILLAYAPFLFYYLFINKLRLVKVSLLKLIFSVFIIAGIISIFSQTYDSYEDELGAYAVENLTSTITTLNETISQTNRQGTESNFNLGAEFDGSVTGLIKLAPLAVVATFFRPFIWEAGKLSQLMAALESLVLIFFTIVIFFKAGPLAFFKYILSDPLVIFCLSFSLVFGIFIGASTLNFGTLVRYKIPCMPFYAIALYLINQKIAIRKAAKERFNISTAEPAIA